MPSAAAEQLPADGSLEGFVTRVGIADAVARAEVVIAGALENWNPVSPRLDQVFGDSDADDVVRRPLQDRAGS